MRGEVNPEWGVFTTTVCFNLCLIKFLLIVKSSGSYKSMADLLHYFDLFLCFSEVLGVTDLHLFHNVSVVVYFALDAVDGAEATLTNFPLY